MPLPKRRGHFIQRFSFLKCSSMSRNTTGVSRKTAIRLGTVIKPFSASLTVVMSSNIFFSRNTRDIFPGGTKTTGILYFNHC